MDVVEKIKELRKSKQKAYVINNESINYYDLINKSLKYSKLLKKQGCGNVLIYGQKSINMVVSILSCLFAHRAYIPVDTYITKNRLKNIIDVSDCDLIINNTEEILNFDNEIRLKELVKYNDYNEKENHNNIAYIIFTSGSTGIPKGVPIKYDNLNNFIYWISNIEGLLELKRVNVLNQASFSFDLSVADLYFSLCNGNTLIGNDSIYNNNLKNMVSIFKDIDIAFLTPTYIKMCLLDKDFNCNIYKKLKCIYFCGELLDIFVVKKLYDRFPKLNIINAYGPTECTSAVTSVLINKDMLNMNLLPVGIVNKSACAINIINNEIVLSGESVFNGYINYKSDNLYKDNNINYYKTGDLGYIENNYLYCKGRIDNQIKYKGYRIELEDIENSIKKIDGVRDSIVIPKYSDNIVKYLNAYVILDKSIDIKKIIVSILPYYMIPKNIEIVDKFIINKNGKVDRKNMSKI